MNRQKRFRESGEMFRFSRRYSRKTRVRVVSSDGFAEPASGRSRNRTKMHRIRRTDRRNILFLSTFKKLIIINRLAWRNWRAPSSRRAPPPPWRCRSWCTRCWQSQCRGQWWWFDPPKGRCPSRWAGAASSPGRDCFLKKIKNFFLILLKIVKTQQGGLP